jgi:hypothetical protein
MNAPETQKPLVVRFGAFGDLILLLPALRILAGRYGASCAVVGSGAWTGPLLRREPAVGRCFLLTSRRAPFGVNRSQRRFVRWLRQRPANIVAICAPQGGSAPVRTLLPDAGAADGRIAGIPPERVLAAWSCLLPAGVPSAN